MRPREDKEDEVRMRSVNMMAMHKRSVTLHVGAHCLHGERDDKCVCTPRHTNLCVHPPNSDSPTTHPLHPQCHRSPLPHFLSTSLTKPLNLRKNK